MQFEIAHKWILLLLPLPLVIYMLVPSLRKKRTALRIAFLGRAAAISGQHPGKRAWVSQHSWVFYLVAGICWTSLLAAASSPRLSSKPAKVPKTTRSFLITVDISFSMAQTDWQLSGKSVSRWEAVRNLMKDFVQQRKSDQMGLVVFGSNAYLQAPLTNDLPMITWLLDQTEVGMAGQMTNIGDAILFSVKILKADTIRQKVIFLITDGIDTGTGIQPVDAAGLAAKEGIVIYTLGIGKSKDAGGYALDEKTLRDIAVQTNGRYFNAMNEDELKKVYTTIEQLTPVNYEEEHYKPVTLLYYYPLFFSCLLALVSVWITAITALIAAKHS